MDDLNASLLAHEARINKSTEKSEKKALQIRDKPSTTNDTNGVFVRGHGKGFIRGRHCNKGRGRERGVDQRQEISDQRTYKSNIQCNVCKKLAHVKDDY